MSVNFKEKIKVYNYGYSPICLTTHNKSILFESMKDGVPCVLPLLFEDIEYINATTPVIRTGLIEFDKSQRSELFKALDIEAYEEKAFFQSELEDAILHPTADFLIKVVNCCDAQTIGRIKGALIGLINTHQYDISERASKVIIDRYNEIMDGKIRTEISVKKIEKAVAANVQTEVVDALQKQIEELKAQMAAMSAVQNVNPVGGSKADKDTKKEPKNKK